MKVFLTLISLTLIFSTLSAPKDDLVTNLPDYPYKGEIYSGYLDIDGSPGKKLHYVFVPLDGPQPQKSPITLWLNGGPGCSSMFGFLNESGPAVFEGTAGVPTLNEFSWNRVSNMLYLEAPAGVGFSTAASDDDKNTNDTITADDNLKALVSFFKTKFPEYITNDFYLSGESYAGIYVPTLADNILNYNETAPAGEKINLKGFMIGNGVTNYDVDIHNALVDFAFYHALYPIEMRADFDKYCGSKRPIDLNNPDCYKVYEQIRHLLRGVYMYDIYRKSGDVALDEEILKINSNMKYPYAAFLEPSLNEYTPDLKNLNFLDDKFEVKLSGLSTYLNRQDVKIALHVDPTIQFLQCTNRIKYDQNLKEGTYPLYKKFTQQKKLKILKFSGDTDAVVPFNGTRAWISMLNLRVLEGERQWSIDEERVGGFVTKYEGLTFLIINGVGHMVPQWKRPEAYHMFDCYINDKSY